MTAQCESSNLKGEPRSVICYPLEVEIPYTLNGYRNSIMVYGGTTSQEVTIADESTAIALRDRLNELYPINT